MAVRWLVLLVGLSTGCFDGLPESGVVLCGAGGACPSSFYCASDNRCWRDGTGPVDAGVDVASAFAVVPSSAVVTVGKPLSFSAQGEVVTWSVLEEGGGTIDTSGRYVAPAPVPVGVGPGTYHVVATRTADGTTASATVEVRGYGAELVAGGLGGPGSLDSIGTGADQAERLSLAFGSRGPGVFLDASQRLWIADTGSCVARLLVQTAGVWGLSTKAGVIGSFAGTGAPTGVGLLTVPAAIAYDNFPATKTLWVGDGFSSPVAVRAYNPTSGNPILVPLTEANPGSNFNLVAGLTVDSAGTLFIADSGSHAISRKLTNQTTASFYAGTYSTPGYDNTGTGLFNGPVALAASPTGALLFVADSSNHAIRQIDTSGGSPVVTTLAGQGTLSGAIDGDALTTARFNSPRGVAVDGAGNVYVADTSNHAIRKIAGGQVTTLAGSLGTGGYADGAAAAARFTAPGSVAVTTDGSRVFVADVGNSSIRLIEGGVVSTISGRPLHQGNADGVGALARFKGPAGLWATLDGTLLISDSGNGRVATIDRDGVVKTLSTSMSTDAGLVSPGNPTATVRDSLGATYVADRANSVVWKADVGMPFRVLAGAIKVNDSITGTGSVARFSSPIALAIAPDDTIYVADLGGHCVRKMDTAGNVSSFVGDPSLGETLDGVGAAAHFNGPTAITIGRDGTLYVADQSSAVIRRVTAAGEVTTFAGRADDPGAVEGAATSDDLTNVAKFMSPGGVGVDSLGNVYVADRNSHRLLGITTRTDGTRFVSKLFGRTWEGGVALLPAPNGALNSPGAILVTAEDDVLVITENSVIRLRLPYPSP